MPRALPLACSCKLPASEEKNGRASPGSVFGEAFSSGARFLFERGENKNLAPLEKAFSGRRGGALTLWRNNMTTSSKAKPIRQFKLGRIRGAIWENSIENGRIFNLTLSRLYKTA